MAAASKHGASGAGPAASERANERPRKDETPELAGGGGFRESEGKDDEADSARAPRAPQALRTIEGERKAREYLARLHTEQADPDELALIVAALYGAALRGFCRVIGKALGVQHG